MLNEIILNEEDDFDDEGNFLTLNLDKQKMTSNRGAGLFKANWRTQFAAMAKASEDANNDSPRTKKKKRVKH